MLREPSVSASDVTFIYGGDLWIAPRHGGEPRRLVESAGPKNTPRFSPDGRTIAFTGNLNGQQSIYTVDANLGKLTQITHTPGNTNLCGWTTKGEIVYMTDAFAPWFNWRVRKLYSVPAAGGLPREFPLAFVGEGAVSPDGRTLAYVNYGIALDTWKRYTGGYAPDIFLLDLANRTTKRVTSWEGLDSTPMWHGANLYYLSDRGPEHRRNIWSYDLLSAKHRQLTSFADFDVTSPSMGPGESGQGEIAFQRGTELALLDLRSERTSTLKVSSLPEQAAQLRQTVDFSRYIQSWQVDPSGTRAIIEARGDLWLVSGESSAVNVTKSAGAAERAPVWSHDGKRIAYFSDASGEYQLQIMDIETGAAQTATKLGNGYRESPVWSPDDSRIAFYDSTGTTYVHTVSTGITTPVAQNKHGLEHRLDYSWSSDSKWLAYVLDGSRDGSAIWMWDSVTGQSHQITSGVFRDREPVFDGSGNYLYFLSTRNFTDLQYGRLDYLTFIERRPDVLMVAPLRDGLALPWNFRPAQSTMSEIDFAGIERRSVRVPGVDGFLSRLAELQGGRLLCLNSPPGEASSLHVIHVQPGGPVETLPSSSDYQVTSARTVFERSAEGVKELLNTPGHNLGFAGMNFPVELHAEWHQVFRDAWRFTRDFFFDKGMNGRNWQEIGRLYESWVDQCASRADLNYVITEMVGELGSSHMSVGNPTGDWEPPKVDVGMLGVDYVLRDGAYQIAALYEGATWDAEARNPLRRPGITVGVGDYLLQVNGKPVDTAQDPWAAFVGLANRPVTLTVSSRPTLDEMARRVTVIPLSSETILRNRDWINANVDTVSRATDGRVGYLYIPDTYFFGTKELLRQLGSQLNKEALIVDSRWNEGGLMPDRLIDILSRPVFYRAERQFSYRRDLPVTAPEVPKCLLTNAMSASGGDSLAFYFQRRHIGPVIGTRTMGAGGGNGGPTPSFVDGGRVEIRWIGTSDAHSGQVIEGRGVVPDILTDDDPEAMSSGRDKQLQAAIELMKRSLRRVAVQ